MRSGVSFAERVALSAEAESLLCILADRLQHREARFVGAFLLTKKALIQQRYEIVERRTADLLGGRGVPTANENTEIEGRVKKLTGYTLHAEGNFILPEGGGRVRFECSFGMHRERHRCADEQKAERADERQLPVARPVDDVAEGQG